MSRLDENEITKKNKRWIPVAAVLTALLVAGSAIAVSAGTAQDAQTTELTLTSETTNTEAPSISIVDVSDVVNDALPSVVSVTSRSLVTYYQNYGGNYIGGNGNIWDYFFGDSYGRQMPDESQGETREIDSGIGSGTIIAKNDTELLVLTSYHVVEESSSLYVTFNNEVSVDGYIKSADEAADIAIVAIPLEDIDQDTLNGIKIATVSTEPAEMGEGVIVIGNALGYGISVTSGIVSAVNRNITVDGMTLTVIQTDAAINAGNSGGCMLNAKGEIIGISEAKVTISNVEGMCYAIPIANNLELIQKLLNSDGVTDDSQGDSRFGQSANGAYLGIRGRDVTSDIANDYGMPLGVYVSSVVSGSGAEEAGIMNGDIIVGVDDAAVSTMEELQYQLSLHKAGDTVALIVNRMTDGVYTEVTVDVTLTDRIS